MMFFLNCHGRNIPYYDVSESSTGRGKSHRSNCRNCKFARPKRFFEPSSKKGRYCTLIVPTIILANRVLGECHSTVILHSHFGISALLKSHFPLAIWAGFCIRSLYGRLQGFVTAFSKTSQIAVL
jgi:hypothetical protein